MRKNIYYTEWVIDVLEKYMIRYREYYHELYSDTGIWSEEQIKNSYTQEAKNRKQEIRSLIEQRLDEDEVLGRISKNTIILPWRSKYLFLSWEDLGDDRFITKLEIR